MKTALVVIARQGYQDVELDGTLKALKAHGFKVQLGSTVAGPCTGKFGGTQQAEIALKDVDVSAYDRVAFIGGPGALVLAENADALRIAKEATKAGMVLGAICIAPVILAKAGVVRGKQATVWDSKGEQVAILEGAGAQYTGSDVTVDGMLVTGNGPHAAEEFGKVFATLSAS
jgi:protease I